MGSLDSQTSLANIHCRSEAVLQLNTSHKTTIRCDDDDVISRVVCEVYLPIVDCRCQPFFIFAAHIFFHFCFCFCWRRQPA